MWQKAMFGVRFLSLLGMSAQLACGGSAPPAQTAADEADDIDPITAIIGEVDVDTAAFAAEEPPAQEVYTGPTLVTFNLKVVNDKNPDGAYRLLDAEGNLIIDRGAFGKPVEINQGVYTVAFKSPAVFGEPEYTMEDVEITGKEMTVDGVFPAGQITIKTYRRRASGPCEPVKFTVYSETLAQDVPGKGKTCEPLVLETGAYRIKLFISKRQHQQVEIKINREQVSTAPIKLE